MTIAVQTRQGKIIFMSLPAMLPRNDVVWLVFMQGGQLRHQAILAAMAGTLCYPLAQRR
jgi:hypothetical protein